MSEDPVQLIHEALETLGLPTMVSYKEIKDRYRMLSKRFHPDKGGDEEEMAKINRAYTILKNYIENYRFSFTEEEILKQFPHKEYIKKFRF
ncbi:MULTISPECIES: J domain-containing protein [unclassified Nitratiruptor]|uniref:J domain-containing protein n=1 Tax=unclassified Nitratiruptor TaxID=2624044 RepID=UPI001914FFE7|nr:MULTISPECIES: J domain-containing protein [unclassified Nitratiruptor]BCD60641.1 heat shock protein [Nitratiruptor sp. YY08-10]BCD64572.1 heat shock protein [Nitratiruptor sp. YY08-14]